jgi:6-phosphofructokinase 1
MKRLGIITVGGDCSGLNTVIRAATIRSAELGCSLVGIKSGFFGFFPESFSSVYLNVDNCDDELLASSGSILGSDTKSFTTSMKYGRSQEEVLQLACDGYEKLELDGLIYIGGDGSLAILSELLNYNPNLKVIAIPKTIDNDVNMTDFAVGFSTAVEVVVDAISNIRSTAKSHGRTMVVEVMGRDAGFIALYAGISAGADVILMPEFAYDMEKVIEKAREKQISEKGYCIIVVAESVESNGSIHCTASNDSQKYATVKYKGIGQYISEVLRNADIDSRHVVLGHLQRGGVTTLWDRIIGTAFGVEAINSIVAGECGIMLAYHNGKIDKVPISRLMQSVGKKLDVSDMYVQVAVDLGIYLGELRT